MGARIVQRALTEPLRCIAENCGVEHPDTVVARVAAIAREQQGLADQTLEEREGDDLAGLIVVKLELEDGGQPSYWWLLAAE